MARDTLADCSTAVSPAVNITTTLATATTIYRLTIRTLFTPTLATHYTDCYTAQGCWFISMFPLSNSICCLGHNWGCEAGLGWTGLAGLGWAEYNGLYWVVTVHMRMENINKGTLSLAARYIIIEGEISRANIIRDRVDIKFGSWWIVSGAIIIIADQRGTDDIYRVHGSAVSAFLHFYTRRSVCYWIK